MPDITSKTIMTLPHLFARMSKFIIVAIAFTSISLLIGILGYRFFENLSWIDSFLNASMILGGMGEVADLKTDGGKIFAGLYALYSGLWVIACMSLIIAPIFHHVLHNFHAKRVNEQQDKK